jgi:hypothetical protein
MRKRRRQEQTRYQEILDKACKELHATTGLRVDVEQLEPIEGADAFGYLRNDGVETPLFIEVKTQPTKALIGAIAQQLKQYPGKGLLAADYINPMMADRLKELDIWFLDTVGNAYINAPPVFIYLKGNKREELLGKGPPKTRAFQPTGLKVLYAFLCNLELVNAPYRDIAHAADVALGTVGWVITDLKELGYLVEMGKKKRRLKGLKKLFDRWVEAYPEQLKPKLLIGKYTTDEPIWWKNTKLNKFDVYMGGEIAAEYLTHYLRPEIKTVYVRKRPQELQLAFRMRKDPNGEIELYKTFWNVECDWIDKKIVNPMLVYADLLATGDPRNIETAEMIYEKEIARYLRED